MRQPVVGINVNGEFVKAVPYVYNGTAWVPCSPKVRDTNAWHWIGGQGCLFFYLIDSDGKYVLDSDENYVLVRSD